MKRVALFGTLFWMVVLVQAAPASALDQVVGVNDVIVANCSCTVNGSRVDIKLASSTLPEDHYTTMRVLARNSGGDRVETGLYRTNGARFTPCDFTGGVLDEYWAWKDGSNYHCGIVTTAASTLYYTAQVRRTTTSSSTWVMMINGSTVQTSGTVFGAPSDIYAGGALNYETSGSNISGSYSCGTNTIDWSRTNAAFNQTATWTAIGGSNQIVEGHWNVGQVPGCFNVTNFF